MTGTDKNDVKFKVVRSAGRTLVDQVVEGLRHAILCGHYRANDVLPSTRELAVELGVSRIVTRAAVRRLAEAGLIAPRVGNGCIVLKPDTTVWRGHVLAAIPYGYESFFQNIVLGELNSSLRQAGYLFSEITVPYIKRRGFDFSQLDYAISQGIDLVCTFHNKDSLFNHLAAANIPYVAIMGGRKHEDGAVGTARLEFNLAVPDFVRACVKRNVKSVIQVSWAAGMADAVPALRRAGIQARDLRLSVECSEGRIVGTQDAAMKAFMKWNTEWPDVLFFNDDNLAVGALSALLARGVRIPEDVSVVAWSNRFLRPVFPIPLTRMEVDPIAAGKIAASAMTTFLASGKFPENTLFGPTWIEGSTLKMNNKNGG